MPDLICTIEQGKVKGRSDVDIDNVPFLSFMGIPYAKPPTGELRFKAPQPPEKWVGIRDATKEGSSCYALHLIPTEKGFAKQLMGSEDCLFLNVYTRQLFHTDQELKPVMVFIHGGGFYFGSSSREMFGPEFLMTEDVVLVTINYRLGALGFLVIDDPSLQVTGNAGLKDQILALKWVQNNIKQFGGDPSNVTIFGHSAGSAAVHYLLLSPSAKGLFHKAIMQSGTALCHWTHGVNNTQQFAQLLGCNESNNKKVLEFLRQVPLEKIIEVQNGLYKWKISEIEKPAFGPTVEIQTQEAFLYEEPLNLMLSGAYNEVPIMMGYTNLEGLLEEILPCGTQPHFGDFVPYYFRFSKKSRRYEETNKKISNFYFGTEKPQPNDKENVARFLTDFVFLRPIYLTTKSFVKTNQKSTYYYRMSLETQLNFSKKMLEPGVKGVCHCDDLSYLFKTNNVDLKRGSLEEISVRRFVRMWANFARTGNPVPVEEPLLNVEWKPMTKDAFNFLDIGAELVTGVNPDLGRMEFWDEISEGVDAYY